MKKLMIVIAVLALMGCGVKSGPMTVEQMVSNCMDVPADDQCGPFPMDDYCQGLGKVVSGKNFTSAKQCRQACVEFRYKQKTTMDMQLCGGFLDGSTSWCTEYCNQNF